MERYRNRARDKVRVGVREREVEKDRERGTRKGEFQKRKGNLETK